MTLKTEDDLIFERQISKFSVYDAWTQHNATPGYVILCFSSFIIHIFIFNFLVFSVKYSVTIVWAVYKYIIRMKGVLVIIWIKLNFWSKHQIFQKFNSCSWNKSWILFIYIWSTTFCTFHTGMINFIIIFIAFLLLSLNLV